MPRQDSKPSTSIPPFRAYHESNSEASSVNSSNNASNSNVRMPVVESPRAHERDSNSASPLAIAFERSLILLNFLVILFSTLFLIFRVLSIFGDGGWAYWCYHRALTLATYSYLLSIGTHVWVSFPSLVVKQRLTHLLCSEFGLMSGVRFH